MKQKKYKQKTKKSVAKRFKITGTGKIMRSHQLRTSHLRRKKSKKTLRRHAKAIPVHKTGTKAIKRMLGIG